MLTIAWDVDDVLNELMRVWFAEIWELSHPDCGLHYDDIRENPPDRILGIEREEYLRSLDLFRTSERARRMAPNCAVLHWLELYGSKCRHIALTARPLDSVPAAAEWVFRHFGGHLRSFGVVPSRLDPDMPVYDADKGGFLRWFSGSTVLVDDSAENVCAAKASGVQGLLYPQPWNESSNTVAEALDHLTGMVASQS